MKIVKNDQSHIILMERKLIWTLALMSLLPLVVGLASYAQAQVNSTNQTGLGNMTASTLTPSGNITNKSTALISNTT
jgi:CHASE3 domain sensor protein